MGDGRWPQVSQELWMPKGLVKGRECCADLVKEGSVCRGWSAGHSSWRPCRACLECGYYCCNKHLVCSKAKPRNNVSLKMLTIHQYKNKWNKSTATEEDGIGGGESERRRVEETGSTRKHGLEAWFVPKKRGEDPFTPETVSSGSPPRR